MISAAQLTGRKPGDNPHLWYDPVTMPAVATALAEALAKADSAHAPDYAARLKSTLASLERIAQRVAQLKAKHAGTVGNGDRAGIRPDGAGAWSDDAQ